MLRIFWMNGTLFSSPGLMMLMTTITFYFKIFEDDKRQNSGIYLNSEAKVVSMDDDKRLYKTDRDFGATSSTVAVDEKKFKHKYKVPETVIKNARENYFRNYYATLKKTPASIDLSPSPPYFTDLIDSDTNFKNPLMPSDGNLQIARRLASLLIFEMLYKNIAYRKENITQSLKRKRNHK
ncbi:unnamed protein product [Parnassius apollo]|uniref:(apollo) hypothetical protein n=1 Tax=Parnassius apollo TaxID=110799 RepID=A0A8S3XSS6_PARAO|nr:unnamed protein product [Parnassius apollo]